MRITFSGFTDAIAHAAGSKWAFLIALLLVIAWIAGGFWVGYGDTYQLVANTSTTLVTFLMIFILQETQNRDTASVQAKLDELIRSSVARNTMIGIDRLSSEEIAVRRSEIEADTKMNDAIAVFVQDKNTDD